MQVFSLVFPTSMSQSLCSLHGLPLSRICASPQCLTPHCHNCFRQHSKTTHHEIAVLLDTNAVDFFLAFLDFLTHELFNWIIQVNHNGYQVLIKHNCLNHHWPHQTSKAQYNRICIETIQQYKDLLTENSDFLSANRQNFSALENHEFYKDLCSYMLSNWAENAKVILAGFRDRMVRAHPSLFRLKEEDISLEPTFLEYVEKERLSLLQKKCSANILKYKDGVVYQTLQNSMVQSPIDTKSASQGSSRSVTKKTSIFEMLNCDDTFFSPDKELPRTQCGTERDSLSPQAIPYEEMSRLVQELMMENEQLKLENSALRSENQALSEENSLKMNPSKSTRQFASILYPLNTAYSS